MTTIDLMHGQAGLAKSPGPRRYFDEFCRLWHRHGQEMRRYLVSRSCPVCTRARGAEEFTSQDGYEFSRCGCGMLYASELIPMLAWNQHYYIREEVRWLEEERFAEQKSLHASPDLTRFREYFLRVARYLDLNGKRSLDIGTFYGDALVAAREQGLIPLGVEGKKPVANHAASVMGRPVRYGFGEDLDNVADLGPFHLISAFEVLEHASAPSESVKGMASVLVPGGLLIITVPNEENFELRVLGPYCSHLLGGIVTTGHVNLFSKETLTRLLESHDFEIIEIFSQYGSNLVNTFLHQSRQFHHIYCYENIIMGRDLSTPKLSSDVMVALNAIGPAFHLWEAERALGPILGVVARKRE